jgi:tripartite-type tricarboxylate transporter receptor subunit TctC
MFDNMPSAIQHVRSGKLRPIAVTTAKRSPELPDVPTIAEAGVPGYEATFWMGMSVPRGTPRAIIDLLHRETTALLKSPDLIEGFRRAGTDAAPSTPDEFGRFIKSEYDKWGKVVRAVGIKP